ncbi:hypothetical protein BCO9919_02728 [Burkholderia cenocepacia]|uniref:Glycosaminoglycan attachment site n=1 Tax=Burkholderia cenocepacia TaxID=95486 RepID=A0A6J5J6W4_9BURK|nr:MULTISPECIES: hypothetical protein [Burkholderia cepacia complex]CAB3967386.1 hypothetical protein BCO9919_02728 [Burkholderia cenocepacia]
MDIFSPLVADDQLHANFKSIISPSMHAERAELVRWLDGFPDRDGKFVKEFQTTFNSSFWEIYLFALFNTYGFELDWAHASPDFHVKSQFGDFIVEATTANAAVGKPAEWEKKVPIGEAVAAKDFWPLNKEAMIRLANAIRAKAQKYAQSYVRLDHVKTRPFVLAIAPFEQPDFQYQYDRAIRAVLYDDYVDETAYCKNPDRFPDGPPSVKLGFVEKENGAEVPLGIFNAEEYRDVSAVLFSCTATWGKVEVMAQASQNLGFVAATWGGPGGKPRGSMLPRGQHSETLEDGVQVFHNPNAIRPLDPQIFRRPGVVQHYFDEHTSAWIHEERDRCLHSRMVNSMRIIRDEPESAVS